MDALLELFWKSSLVLCGAAFASLPMMRLYQRLGMRMFVLGPPREYWGMERYPVRFGSVEAFDSMSARWRSVLK